MLAAVVFVLATTALGLIIAAIVGEALVRQRARRRLLRRLPEPRRDGRDADRWRARERLPRRADSAAATR